MGVVCLHYWEAKSLRAALKCDLKRMPENGHKNSPGGDPGHKENRPTWGRSWCYAIVNRRVVVVFVYLAESSGFSRLNAVVSKRVLFTDRQVIL